ncbi:OPT oligopeptide transporter protein-domain-containing protein [Lipomyces japonicus]|uniref:OPT oligopeptide transporter protein-domain-containing protein n=1 Tax=Lipomyces japonicus TaxID=56871 RepID=UPI0034CE3EA4
MTVVYLMVPVSKLEGGGGNYKKRSCICILYLPCPSPIVSDIATIKFKESKFISKYLYLVFIIMTNDEKKVGVITVAETDDLVQTVESFDLDKKKNLPIIISTSSSYFHNRNAVLERILSSDDMNDIFTEDADFIIEKMQTLDAVEALEVLDEAYDYFDTDINFPEKSLKKIALLRKGEESYGQGPVLFDLDLRLEACLIKYHSPYPEVRSVCSPLDDPLVPVETFRAYLIGSVWVAIGAFINQIINFRQPRFSLTSQVIQLLVYPSGQALAKILPDKTVLGIRLNPGPWTFKEQMFTTIITNVGAHGAVFITYAPTMRLKMFYGQEWMGFGFTVAMGFCVQFFGMGMAGVLRRWAVYPVKAMWPTLLPTIQLNRTLLLPETRRTIHGWSISKYKFFFVVLGCSFLYTFIPNYLFTALSTFNWITWIAPQNKNLAFVSGSRIGAGFNPISSFDWAIINYSSPLVLPFFTVVNRYIGTAIAGVIVLIAYYKNYMFSAFIPPNTADVYDRFGKEFNVTRVLTNGRLDVEKYMAYSPPYISAGNLISMAVAYMIYTFAFVYILLNEWHIIKEAVVGFYHNLKDRQLSNYERYKDPISVMMRSYAEVPDWWFLIVLVGSVVVGCVSMAVFPTTTPVWVIVVVVVISIAILIPFIVLYSSTGYFMSMNMLGTLLGGYLVPGNGIACIFTRIFGYGLEDQAETFVGDQKLAHYCKLPPRAVFRAQIYASLIQIFCTAGALEILIQSLPDFCSYTQESRFVCVFAHSLYSDSLLLGVVGPKRTFDMLYPTLKWCFLIGALLAVPCFYARKFFPNKLRYVHPVLLLGGFLRYGATYNLSYYTPGFYVSFAFMFFIRRRFLAWWVKYNYILSSGLSGGLAFAGILIFLTLQLKPKRLIWWGNKIQSAGVDGKMVATLKSVPAGGYFGVPEGTWE